MFQETDISFANGILHAKIDVIDDTRIAISNGLRIHIIHSVYDGQSMLQSMSIIALKDPQTPHLHTLTISSINTYRDGSYLIFIGSRFYNSYLCEMRMVENALETAQKRLKTEEPNKPNATLLPSYELKILEVY